MVVWGGSNGANYLGSGARYDPALDSWTLTSTGGSSPAPRERHTAVWTGSAMIVWGGSDYTGPLGDGARYDPAADSWTPVSAASAPSPRSVHSALWTGSRMLVWGGASSDPGGGSYDPVADQWSPISTASAPSPRSGHAAVLAGGEMWIWGGFAPSPNVLLADGGRYDPATDLWAPMDMTGLSLSPRAVPAAVSTGSTLIVWGGFDGTAGAPGGAVFTTTAPVEQIFYLDADGDGWGDSDLSLLACSAPPGYVSQGGDCDDSNLAVSPGSVCEAGCDGLDNDCDGIVDNACP
jgi:hypothetical protein